MHWARSPCNQYQQRTLASDCLDHRRHNDHLLPRTCTSPGKDIVHESKHAKLVWGLAIHVPRMLQPIPAHTQRTATAAARGLALAPASVLQASVRVWESKLVRVSAAMWVVPLARVSATALRGALVPQLAKQKALGQVLVAKYNPHAFQELVASQKRARIL